MLNKSVETAQDAARAAAASAQAHIQADPWFWVNVVGAVVVLLFCWGRDIIRPGSLTRGGLRGVREHGVGIWLAAAGLAYMVQILGAGLVLGLLGLPTNPGTDMRAMAITGGVGTGLGVVTALVLGRLLGMSAPKAGILIRAGDLPLGVVCGVAVFPVTQAAAFGAVALQQALGRESEHIAHDTLAKIVGNPHDPWAWLLTATAVLGAPIVEEFVFRGCIQSGLLRLTGRPGLSVVVASLAFAAAHLGVAPWYGLVPIFVLAAGAGVAFERTKSLAVPIAMHVVFNAANVAMALLGPA